MDTLIDNFTVKAANLQPGMIVDFAGDLAYSAEGYSAYIREAEVLFLPVPAVIPGFVRTVVRANGQVLHVESWAESNLRIEG